MLPYQLEVVHQRRLKWTPELGPGIAEVKVQSRLPLSFKSSSFLLLLLRLLWVCGQRVCVVQAKRISTVFAASILSVPARHAAMGN
jgi:hypothetical protein